MKVVETSDAFVIQKGNWVTCTNRESLGMSKSMGPYIGESIRHGDVLHRKSGESISGRRGR